MTILVGRVLAVDSADRPGRPDGAAEFAKGIESAEVTLDDGRSCALDSGRAEAPHQLRLLKMLSHAGMPVYLETDAARNVIDRLLIPGVFRVRGVAREPVGDRLDVELSVSHSRDYVSTTNPDRQRIIETLRTAAREGAGVLVTQEPNRAEIIDARLTDLTRPAAIRPSPKIAATPSATFTTLSDSEAQFAFELVNVESCSTTIPSPACIPFVYPDKGCWARSHEMCRILIANGIAVNKIWSYGPRQVPTRNHPDCTVHWMWHTAPVVGGDGEFGGSVIDPSLFDGPATVADWLARQPVLPPGVPDDFEFTDPSIYVTERADPDSLEKLDPFYVNTNAELMAYRFLLLDRCKLTNPPGPPYPNCL